MKPSLLALLLGSSLFASTSAMAEHSHPPMMNIPTVNISTAMEREVDNDRMQARLRVEATSKTYNNYTPGMRVEADEVAGLSAEVNGRMEQLLKKARALPDLVIKTDRYTTSPHYHRGTITGWKVTQTVSLEGSDFDALSKLIGDVSELAVVEGISFSVSPDTQVSVKNDLRNEAIAAFNDKAQQVAMGFGYDLYQINSVHVSDGGASRPMHKQVMAYAAMESDAMMGRSAPAVEGGKNTVSVNVSGSIYLVDPYSMHYATPDLVQPALSHYNEYEVLIGEVAEAVDDSEISPLQ